MQDSSMAAFSSLPRIKAMITIVVTITVLATTFFTVIGVGSGQFMSKKDCICPGDIATFNCNITGGGFTIWRGSAFDCPTVESIILLRHSLFINGVMKLCNEGGIIGQSLGISTNSLGSSVYMSQLMINLTANSNVIGRTVECVYRNPSGMDTVIGSATLEITDPPPPPSNIQLIDVSPKQLVFNWTKVDSNCSTFKYKVLSDCGTCFDDITTVTVENTANSVACPIDLSASAVTNNMTMCSFRLVNIICSDILHGTTSTPLNITLKVPQPPAITSTIPHYNKTDNKLIGIDTKFNEGEFFMISNGVDGSALNYTISYTDSNTGDVCYSITISASSCVHGICTVPSISPLCSEIAGDGNIDISISATNKLGTGPSSFTTIGQTNEYFNVSFEMTNKIVCTQWHLSPQESQSQVMCDVIHWPCQHQQQPMAAVIAHGAIIDTSSPNIVNIDLPEILPRSNHCYAVNASNGTITIIILIEGSIESRSDSSILVAAAVLGCAVISIISIFSILIYWTYKKGKRKFILHIALQNTRLSDTSSYNLEAVIKPTVLLKRDGDCTILIFLQDKPWQLMKALEAFKESEIDIVDTKIIECEHGYAKISIQCKESPSDDKVKCIKQKIESITKEEIPAFQNRGQQMTYSKKFPPKYGSLYTFMKQVSHIGLINIVDINVHPTSTDSTYRDITLRFFGEPEYPENWTEEFDKVYAKCVGLINS